MIEIKKTTESKRPGNPSGVVLELYINGFKKKEIPVSNLGPEINAAEENRKMYQNKADQYAEIRDQLKTFK